MVISMKIAERHIERSEGASSIDLLAETGASNPALIDYYNVDVREFVLLACLYEEGEMDISRTAAHVGLSPTTTRYCLSSLMENSLVLAVDSSPAVFLPTEDGRALIRKSRHSGHK